MLGSILWTVVVVLIVLWILGLVIHNRRRLDPSATGSGAYCAAIQSLCGQEAFTCLGLCSHT
jgi:hypothetical protein